MKSRSVVELFAELEAAVLHFAEVVPPQQRRRWQRALSARVLSSLGAVRQRSTLLASSSKPSPRPTQRA
jgi:hypothetical protein